MLDFDKCFFSLDHYSHLYPKMSIATFYGNTLDPKNFNATLDSSCDCLHIHSLCKLTFRSTGL